jgi:hypothetical protein
VSRPNGEGCMGIIEAHGDLWEVHAQGYWVAITTNSVIRANGHGVMGAGLAKQAADRFPRLPSLLGTHLRQFGNIPASIPSMRIVTLPTKHHFRTASDLALIQRSLQHIQLILTRERIDQLYCPRPGCGLGQLSWVHVRGAIASHVDHRFIFLHLGT